MAVQKLQEVANRKERKIFTFKGIKIEKKLPKCFDRLANTFIIYRNWFKCKYFKE
jgi:hypothetical protein